MPRISIKLTLFAFLLGVSAAGCDHYSEDREEMQLTSRRAELAVQQLNLQNQFNALSQKPAAQRTAAENSQLNSLQLQINILRSDIAGVDDRLLQLRRDRE